MMRLNITPYGVITAEEITAHTALHTPHAYVILFREGASTIRIFREKDYINNDIGSLPPNHTWMKDVTKWLVTDKLPDELMSDELIFPVHLYVTKVTDDGKTKTGAPKVKASTLKISPKDDLNHSSNGKANAKAKVKTGPALAFIAYHMKQAKTPTPASSHVTSSTYVWVVQITHQTYRRDEFNPLKGSDTFTASNGYRLMSCDMPEPTASYTYVRGGSKSYDHSFIAFDDTTYKKFVKAVEEYNDAVGPQPITETGGEYAVKIPNSATKSNGEKEESVEVE